MAGRKPRVTRVTKEQVMAHAVKMSLFDVRWSRPGVDVVRVGKGYAASVDQNDGSLQICNFLTGGIHSIMPEYVDRRVTVKTKRSTRQVWQKWSDDDTVALIEFATKPAPVDEDGDAED